MHNYFKTIVGHIATTGEAAKRSSLAQEFFFFDDADPSAVRAAKAEAREAFGGRGVVSVWRRAITVPDAIRLVGEVRAGDDVLQPGMVNGTREHSTGLVAA